MAVRDAPLPPDAAGLVPPALLDALDRRRRYPWRRIAVGLVALAVALAVGVAVGASSISPLDVLRVLLARVPGLGVERTWPASWDLIVWQIRAPRVVLAALVGMGLAAAGGTYQGLFRNPLADPYLISAASGAGLGVAVVLFTPVPATVGGVSLLPVAAFAGSLSSVTVAYAVARRAGGVSLASLLLAGVALSSILTSVTSVLMLRANPDVRPLLAWLLGGLNTANWHGVAMVLPYLLVSVGALLAYARVLNVLQLGEEQARALGVNVERAKVALIAAASLATAAAVSVSGLIGFVGLIAPHVVRMLWGADHRTLLPVAMLAGGAFLVLADAVGRLAAAPAELPVGVVTAVCGGPFFIWLLRRRAV